MLIFICLLVQSLDAIVQAPPAIQRSKPQIPAAMEIDDQRVNANGIRKLNGKHLILYTDVRERTDIDELGTVFDLAVPQWCDYFGIDAQLTQHWRMTAFVIEDKSRFEAAGLIPADLPHFPAGYQRGHEMWLYVQPGEYYSRHLLLHEGTHAFMSWFVGGFGAPWYSEGMAEWMGLNRWQPQTTSQAANLKINFHVTDRQQTPYWGRVKVIREAWDAGTALSLEDVLNIPGRAFRDVRFYGWAWAGCEFLSHHELSQTAFADFGRLVNQPERNFDRSVQRSLEPHVDVLARDWKLFISEMDYGIDVSKTRLIPATKSTEKRGLSIVSIAADHGWQTTPMVVNAGDRWRVSSPSKFVVGKSIVTDKRQGKIEKPWLCEANGITLEYYRGRPIGMLLAGVYQPDAVDSDVAISGLLMPLVVGQKAVLEIPCDGVLCLRINESPARMEDNQGVLEVSLEKLE